MSPDDSRNSSPDGPGRHASPSGTGREPQFRHQADGVRRTLPEHFRNKGRHTDTAGVAWAGRDYAPSPFPGDTGGAAPRISEALAAIDRGEDHTREGVVNALRGERVLVPVQAIATETATTESGLQADNASDMAMVKLQLASNDVALPVFSSVASLSAWNPQARPVPMVCEQAAQAAVGEGCTSLLLDPGRGVPVVLTRSALWAIAQGRPWVAPYDDPVVHEEVDRLPSAVSEVRAVRVRPGEEREVELVLCLADGLGRSELEHVVRRVQGFLAQSQVIADRVSSLKLTLTKD